MTNDRTLELVAAMTGHGPGALVPGVTLGFGGVTSRGLARLQEARIEMAMPQPLKDLCGPDTLLSGRFAVDATGRVAMAFSGGTLAFGSRDEALDFLADIRRPLRSWSAEGGSGRTYLDLSFEAETLVPV